MRNSVRLFQHAEAGLSFTQTRFLSSSELYAAKAQNNARHGGNTDEHDGVPALSGLDTVGQHQQHRRKDKAHIVQRTGPLEAVP